MKTRLRRQIFLLLLLGASWPLSAATARLIGPSGRCLAVEGLLRAPAPLQMEACGDRPEQLWQMPVRGFSGPIRIGGDSCLFAEAGAPRVDLCGQETQSHRWRHETDGRMVGPGGLCLEAAAGVGLALCDGGEDQVFLAEGQNSWSPAIFGEQLFLPSLIPTMDPKIWYGSDIFSLLRSENFGQSWALLPVDAAEVAVAPTDPNLLWVGRLSIIQRSADGGKTWLPVLEAEQAWILPSRVDPQRVYVVNEDQLWLSLDQGLSFEPRGAFPQSEGYFAGALVEAADGDLFLNSRARCSAFACGETSFIYRSQDRGASWQQVLSIGAAGWNSQLLADPTAAERLLYMRHYQAPRRSFDGGNHWSDAPGLPATDGRLQADPGRPGRLYFFSADAMWRSDDWATTWQEIASPFDFANELYTSGNRLLSRGYVQSLGRTLTYESLNDGATWLELPSTRGFLPAATQRLFATTQPGKFFAYSEAAVGGWQIFRTDDRGRSWHPGVQQNFDFLRPDPSAANTFYGSDLNTIYRSTDGGATLQAISPQWHAVRDLEVVRSGDQTALLALLENSHVRRSLDGGASWNDFSILPPSFGEPEEQVLSLAVDGETIYASTIYRVLYRSRDGGATWQLRNNQVAHEVQAGGGILAFIDYQAQAVSLSIDGGLTWENRLVPAQLSSSVTELWIDRDGTLYLKALSTFLRSRDRGKTWQALTADFPGFDLADVAVDPVDPDRLLIGSHDGIWLGRFDDRPPLALADGRFEARLTWRDRQGLEGHGVATALTDDTGLFWLFTPERSEIAVKLLDARHLNGRFWVFVGSLSDVEIDLEIHDRATGETWRHHNPQGQMLSLGDTAAFPKGEAPLARAVLAEPDPGISPAQSTVMLGGRFEISVEWHSAAGSGSGRGMALSADTAAFNFFSETNVELLVNVIDGRSINGKYWVFYASLSNVEYSISVRDTVAKTTKVYQNRSGVFASSADTGAF